MMRWADAKIHRLLVVMPSWVGDTVMATPFLRALRTAAPFAAARVTAYLRPGLDEIVAGLDSIDEVIVGRPAGLIGPWREGRRLARHRFDAAILLPNSWRLAATLFLARIPRRLGYGRDGRTPLLTDVAPCPMPGGWRAAISAVDYYLHLASLLDADAADKSVRLTCTDQQQQAADALLTRAGITPRDRIALLNPGANRADKRWPADRFARLADYLAGRHHMRVVVNGSPAERSLIDSVCAQSKSSPANLPALGATLGSLKGICARAALVVTNDTGTRHIAAGLAHESATRLISLFGPTDPQWSRLDIPGETEIATTPRAPIHQITFDKVAAACDSSLADS